MQWPSTRKLGEYDFSDEKLKDSLGIPPEIDRLKHPEIRELQKKMNSFMVTLDRINARYGAGTAAFGDLGVCGEERPLWEMKNDMKSHRYTTCWQELVCAR